MPKAKAHPGQLGFVFEAPEPAVGQGCLAGLEQRINATVATILASAALDGNSRAVVAAKMADVLGEPVSKEMLDAYASPARTEHRVPASRLLALVAVTGRHDLLDPRLREIGAALLVGEEVQTARLGHVRRQIKELQDELRRLEGSVPLIRSGGTDGNSAS